MSDKPKIHFDTVGPTSRTMEDSSKHLGYLGRFFGGVENAPASISGFIVILLIVIGGLNNFYKTEIAMEYWTLITPIITGLFGYLFGKSKNKLR